jgi:hypothetical protein
VVLVVFVLPEMLVEVKEDANVVEGVGEVEVVDIVSRGERGGGSSAPLQSNV